jgi:hypothetical protein
MFQFLLGVLIFASNFLAGSRASAETGAGSGPGAMERGRWRNNRAENSHPARSIETAECNR